MSGKILKILWIVIIFLFVSLQIYGLIKSGYTDVTTSILTVIILLALIIAYWLIAQVTKVKTKKKNKEKDNQDLAQNI